MARDITEESFADGATLFVAADGPIATADDLDALAAAVSADVAIVVSVGPEAEAAFTEASLGTIPEVIGIGVSDEGRRSDRLAAPFRAHERVAVSLDDPSDLGEVGQAINRAVSDHVNHNQRPVIIINSISAILRHNTAEHVFYFLHLLDGLIERTNGIGLYLHDIAHHETHEFSTLGELVDDVTAVPGLETGSVDLTIPLPSYGDRVVNVLVAHSPLLWVLAVLTFGMTDIVTTFIGLSQGMAHEASPLASAIFGDHGFGFIYVIKAAVFLLFYFLWRFIPTPYNVSIPLGLFIVGSLITAWNLVVITSGIGG